MAVAVEMHDALEGQAAHWRSPGIAGKLHNRVGGQIVATSLFNLAFCLAVGETPSPAPLGSPIPWQFTANEARLLAWECSARIGTHEGNVAGCSRTRVRCGS